MYCERLYVEISGRQKTGSLRIITYVLRTYEINFFIALKPSLAYIWHIGQKGQRVKNDIFCLFLLLLTLQMTLF